MCFFFCKQKMAYDVRISDWSSDVCSSDLVSKAGFGNTHAGDWSVGVKATYLQRWDFGINYVNFFGKKEAGLREDGNFSYGQSLADRDFVAMYVKTTF